MISGCVNAPEHPLRVATTPWPGYESLHLAASLGTLDSTRVRLVDLANAGQVAQGLRNGTVDAGTMTLDETLVVIQEGVPLHVVLVMDVSNGGDVVVARPEIADVFGLRGKRVGVETAAVGAVMLEAVLAAAGLTTNDITLVSLSVNEHDQAYALGTVDALVTFDPARTRLLARGAHVIFDSRSIPGRIVDVLAVRADAMADHQQALTTLVAAHFRALDHLARSPQDAAGRIAPFLGVPADQVLAQFTGLILPDLAENRVQLSGPAARLPVRAAELGALMLRSKLLPNAVSVDNLVESRFLPPATP